MKRKLTVFLALLLAFTTCFATSAFAETGKHSTHWSQSSDLAWHLIKNNELVKNAWVYDDECDVEGGLWYLLDENGNLVTDPVIVDGNGRYYTFRQEHDGHFGAMNFADGIYDGIKLSFNQNHDGSYGSVSNSEGIKALKAKYNVREMTNLLDAPIIKTSEIRNYIIDDSSDDYEPVWADPEPVVPLPVKLITITVTSDSKIYDGTPLAYSDYTYTPGILAEGDVLSAVIEGTITDAGSTENRVKSYMVLRDTEDVTDEYSFVIVNGTLTVDPREVTLTSDSASKTYDGTPLTANNVTVSNSGFVGTEGAAYIVTGSQTEIGTSSNYFTYELDAGTKAGNYVITMVEGILTVTPQAPPM